MKEKNVTMEKERSLSDNEAMTGIPSLPEKRSWVVRKWKWMIVCFIPVFIAGIFMIAMNAIKSSEPYKKALSLAQSNPAVKSVLGQPIEAGWFISGSISESEAGFEIAIKGNRSGGTVYVDADKHAGHWRYKNITVQPDVGGESIDLLAGGNAMK
ncbi:cytochrome c oxidase assembly factor Coa1 family protein [Photorhabdus aegyptia]|uniref:Cytochrome oxidase complex assembly protein 1 n=1 Tax=Photorhabdus aegyptia TaxID=2805098 RepID=A0A022PFK5_9GAMM|nr:cytochrome c oxidase assembly factor Coa1 family protein [Photorhabdus aegyptia]EYU13220.1 Cytochrome oxidase complex assembly protein 1 [Photorhabdus aegyptia]